jgi:hypothetical protein
MRGRIVSSIIIVAGGFAACMGPVVLAEPMGSAITYQGRLLASGDPAEGLYDFEFRLFDGPANAKQVGPTVRADGVEVEDGHFTAILDFGEKPFVGQALWLDIRVGRHSPFPIKKTYLSPRQPVTPTPYALHALRAEQLTGTIDASQIEGLLGGGYTILFPDVLYNQVQLWIKWTSGSYDWLGPGVVVVGPGVDIDRIEGFDPQGKPADNPGFAMEHPFVFEANDTMAGPMKTYIDAHPGEGPVTCTLRIPELSGDTYLYMNLSGTVCTEYKPGTDGRTRFTFAVMAQPDNLLTLSLVGPDLQAGDFGSAGAYNPATDMKVLIDGIAGQFYPEVVVDANNRTLTFTYSSREGAGIYGWVKSVVEGTNVQRALIVIRLDAEGAEVERDNYSGCFPLRYEILDGFGLDTALRARVVLSYNVRQPG